MPNPEVFIESPEGTREEIMRATYYALCDYGYSALTIQRIGERFSKSKSLIYHHYDGKDELLLDFLEFMLEQAEEMMPLENSDSAEKHLDAVLDHVFQAPLPQKRRDFHRAMVELRAQAAHEEAYREHFTRHDQFFTDRIASIIERGIDQGVFRAVDPVAVARFLVTTINGSINQNVTSNHDGVENARNEVDWYTRSRLLDTQ